MILDTSVTGLPDPTESLAAARQTLDNTDPRSANPLKEIPADQSVAALQSNNVAGMESLDIVKRGNYLYAMQKEEGKEPVFIPVSPEKATGILAARNELRRDASERLRQKQEDLENKQQLVKGLRAAGYTPEELQALTEALMGMDFPNAQAMVRDLLQAKVKGARKSGSGSAVETMQAHMQKVRHTEAQSARTQMATNPELDQINIRIAELEKVIKNPLDNTPISQQVRDELAGLQTRRADLTRQKMALEESLTVVGSLAVPNTSEVLDDRSYFQASVERIMQQGVSSPTQEGSPDPLATQVLNDMIPLINVGRQLPNFPKSGASVPDVFAFLNDLSQRLTGRMFVTDPAQQEMVVDLLRQHPQGNIFPAPTAPAGALPATTPPAAPPTQPQPSASEVESEQLRNAFGG